MIIPVSQPHVSELEIKYVNEALNSNAISGVFGEFIEKFELDFLYKI